MHWCLVLAAAMMGANGLAHRETGTKPFGKRNRHCFGKSYFVFGINGHDKNLGWM